MRLFLDTEFTDFFVPELISIGLVSEDGKREFYAELNTFDPMGASDFVKACVLPVMDYSPVTTVNNEELKRRLIAFLDEFSTEREVVVCFDSGCDWAFFLAALGNELPTNVKRLNIDAQVPPEAIKAWFEQDLARLRHHALHDAKGLRWVFIQNIEE